MVLIKIVMSYPIFFFSIWKIQQKVGLEKARVFWETVPEFKGPIQQRSAVSGEPRGSKFCYVCPMEHSVLFLGGG